MSSRESCAAYYRRHRDEILRRVAAYRKKNKKRILRWQRAYAKRNPKRFRASYRKYYATPKNRMVTLFTHATQRGRPYDLRLKYLLMANPPSHCACCQKLLDYSVGRGQDKKDSPSLDRWDNSKGYTLDNTHVVCYRCNELKRDATLSELKLLVRYMS